MQPQSSDPDPQDRRPLRQIEIWQLVVAVLGLLVAIAQLSRM
jgi:hypothetical protein